MMKKEVNEKMEVILTEREQAVIKWLARTAYATIKADFWEDGKEKYFSAYMSVVTMLNQHENMNAMYFICTLLDQGYSEDIAELTTEICKPDDGSIELFMNEFKEYLIYDMFYEEDDDFDEDEFDDEEMDIEELDEDPFAVISVAVDKEKCPGFESHIKEILQTLGIPFPELRKKECEESE